DLALGRVVHRVSGGSPRAAVEVVRAAAARARSGQPPSADDVRALEAGDLGALAGAALERLSAPVRRVIDVLAVIERRDRPGPVDELAELAGVEPAEVLESLRSAEDAGLVELDAGARFPSRAHAQAVLSQLKPARSKTLHRRALALASIASHPI